MIALLRLPGKIIVFSTCYLLKIPLINGSMVYSLIIIFLQTNDPPDHVAPGNLYHHNLVFNDSLYLCLPPWLQVSYQSL